MTNKEKYAKEILDIVCETAEPPALVNGKLVACNEVGGCCGCKFSNLPDGCGKGFKAWVQEEYKVPEIDWTKVPVDTKILVRKSEDREWLKRYFSHFDETTRKVRTFNDGSTSWSADEVCNTSMWKYAKIADPEEQEKYLKYE